MGFGRGILEKPHRGTVSLAWLNQPFGTIVSQLTDFNVRVVSPEGTPPFRAPRWGDLPRFLHEEEPLGIVPAFGSSTPHRTLISDARDLLVSTLYERTGFRGPDDQIIPERSPLLRCEVEGPTTWDVPPLPALWPGGTPIWPGYIHIGRTRRAEQILQSPALGYARIAFGWDGRLDSLDGDGYVILIVGGTAASLQPPPLGLTSGISTGGDLLGLSTQRHIVLAGATDLGTYYAVADFLRRYAGAYWLFPGAVGTVIPREFYFDLSIAELHIQEPDYRGRVLSGLADGGLQRGLQTGTWSRNPIREDIPNQTDQEVHDIRNWLLRNRLHPFAERAVLHERRTVPRESPEHVDFKFCAPLAPDTRKFLAVESRIPVGHKLSSFFSPHLPSMDARVRRPVPHDARVDSIPQMYPDCLPRAAQPVSDVRLGQAPVLSSRATSFSPCTLVSPGWAECASRNETICECPIEEVVEGSPPRARMLQLQPLRLPSNLGVGCTGDPVPVPAVTQALVNQFSHTVSTTEENRVNTRFVPRSRKFTHFQDSAPFVGWAPCLFAPGTMGGENDFASFRETVAVDLANQLIQLNMNRRVLWRTREVEFCETLAADDGDRHWCECVPCRSTNSRDAHNDSALVFGGRAYLRNVLRFEHGGDSTNTAIRTLWLCQDPDRLALQMQHARGIFVEAIRELSAPMPNSLLAILGLLLLPTSGSTLPRDPLDRLALRGVLPDNARLHVRSRRIFVLMNRTATLLTSIASSPDTYQGLDPAGLLRESLPDPHHTLLTFLAYLDYTAPPIFEKDPSNPAQNSVFYSKAWSGKARDQEFYGPGSRVRDLTRDVLHPILTPMIVGSRDLLEFDDEPATRRRYSIARAESPFWQHRVAPEHLNLRRWALVANQIGLYEYMYSAIAPRIYTKRLSNALKTSFLDHRARVFTAEATPSFGLDGIRFYEVARMLWDVNEDPRVLRQEYCRALCFPNREAATAMESFFNRVEAIWCTRELGYRPLETPQHRYVSGFNLGTFQGYGIVGALGWITELEPFMRSPESRSMNRDDGNVPEPGRMPFDTAWAHLNRAWELCRGTDPAQVRARERVQFFRRAFGMVGVVIRAFHPIWRAWTQFETALGRPDTREPQDSATGWVARTPPPEAQAIRARTRSVLMSGGTLTPWATPEGFRRQVRGPIHQYLTSFYDVHRGLGGELGLGLSGVRLIPTSGQFGRFDPAGASFVLCVPPQRSRPGWIWTRWSSGLATLRRRRSMSGGWRSGGRLAIGATPRRSRRCLALGRGRFADGFGASTPGGPRRWTSTTWGDGDGPT